MCVFHMKTDILSYNIYMFFSKAGGPSSPCSEVNVHKHHFCHLIVAAPHVGSRGCYHPHPFLHSFSLIQIENCSLSEVYNNKKVLS